MRITSVDLYGSNDVLIATLSFRDPGSNNPYIAKAIVGLDADEIVPRFYGISNVSKSKYYSLTLEQREIVLKISLNPSFATQTYSDLRDELYKMIASSRTGKIELRFNNRTLPVAHIFGFVKKFEAVHFSDDPEVQITMECDDPMIRGLDRVEAIGTPLQMKEATITDNISTAPHGFIFNITFTEASDSFIVQDSVTPEWSFVVIPGTIGSVNGFVIGDQLYYSSEYANKYLYLFRGGQTLHLVDKVRPDSIWPIIFPGDNSFNTENEEFTWDHVSYYPTYWGI